MDTSGLVPSQRRHLSGLLEAIQRCVYFLDASDQGVPWPLTGGVLVARKKDNDLFEALAAVKERFSKLQDALGSAMRHSLSLSGEQADSFIKVLAIFEKFQVIDSIEAWQVMRTARNLAAHDYETDYAVVAEHFNTLHALKPSMYGVARRFVAYCEEQLSIKPLSTDFAGEFFQITRLE